MIPPRRWLILASIFLAGPALTSSRADAAMLWYNGDYDNRDALANGSAGINYNGPFLQVSKVYENFIVPTGQTWTVTSVYSTDEILYKSGVPVTKASWEIRSGVGSGNGGTLVASGDTAATQTPVTKIPGYTYSFNPTLITATVPSVTLAAGTYWLSVIPDDTAPFFGDKSYVETTSGANSVGKPPGNDDNSFISNNLTGAGGYNFTPTSSSSVEGPGTWDYSMGVSGTSTAVPEPSSLMLVVLGVLAAPAVLRLRARRRPE